MSTLKTNSIEPVTHSDPLVFRTNATETMRLATDGSLLLGIQSSPDANTIIAGQKSANASVLSRLYNPNTGTSALVALQLNNNVNNGYVVNYGQNHATNAKQVSLENDVNGNGLLLYSGSAAGPIRFCAGGGAERMTINSSGKIVVNNARGDVGASTTLTGQNALGTIHFVQSTTNDNWVGMTTSATTSATTSQGGILIQGSGAYGTKIHFLTTDSYAAGQKNRMTIDHFGNVGIGTNAPTNRLHVVGTSPDTAPVFISNGAGGDDQTAGNCMGLRIRAGDGSGTATLLDVQSSDGATTHFAVRKDGVVARGRSIMGGFMPNSIVLITGAKSSSAIFNITVPGTSTERYMGILQRPNYSQNQGDGVFSYYLSDENGPVELTGGSTVSSNIDGGIGIGTPYAPTGAWLYGMTIFWWRVS